MNAKTFSTALGGIDDKFITKAINYQPRRKSRSWVKWGAVAACLCIVVGCVFLYQNLGIAPTPAPGDGATPGGQFPGQFPDGVDPIISSLAVYPASEDVRDVEDATMESISEADAYGMEALGEYLPALLPDGYSFDSAYLYETTMKDGTKYYLMRVTYTDGGPFESEDAGDNVPPPGERHKFDVFIMSYRPRTERKIYTPDEITESTLKVIDGMTFHISYGDIYVGISPNTSEISDIMTVVASIQP